jgi:hypothetical protein
MPSVPHTASEAAPQAAPTLNISLSFRNPLA